MLTALTTLSTAAPQALGPSWLNPEQLLENFGGLALWGAALVIFAECGLLLGFFLPGDSLLFTVGLFIGRGTIHYPIWVACLVLTAAAFIGNVVGYEIGRASGPAVFNKPNSKIFKQEYVDKSMAFFDHYGARAIVLARFVPVVRTFITVVAGVGKMDRRVYLTYSGIGALLWASGVTILGRLLGKVALFRDHLEAGLLLLVVISVIPMFIEAYRHRSRAKKEGTTPPTPGDTTVAATAPQTSTPQTSTPQATGTQAPHSQTPSTQATGTQATGSQAPGGQAPAPATRARARHAIRNGNDR